VEQFLSLAVVGLTAGAVYALVAMSFNVIFATTGVLNFAQGELFMAGAMLCAVLYSDRGLSAPLALVITVVVVALIALVEERLAVRNALKSGRGAMGWVLATLGFSIVTASVFALAFGPNIRQPVAFIDNTPRSVGPVTVSLEQIVLVVVALLVAGVLHTFYQRTLAGVAMRGVSQDAEAASLRSIPVARLGAASFVISGAVVGAAGFLAAPVVGAYPTMGFAFALQGFVAAALGGIPSIKGAVVGGFALGLVESFGGDLIGPGYRTALVFAVLIAVLALRPAGLFGRLTARAV
jgi:branched-chain amino acid transport system permease protein